jgi:hypothetical protein
MAIEPFTPVTREEAARRLSVSVTTLDAMIDAGGPPEPIALGGRRVYWHPDVFYGWLDKHLRPQEGQGGDAGPPAPEAPKVSTSEASPSEKARTRDARKLAKMRR